MSFFKDLDKSIDVISEYFANESFKSSPINSFENHKKNIILMIQKEIKNDLDDIKNAAKIAKDNKILDKESLKRLSENIEKKDFFQKLQDCVENGEPLYELLCINQEQYYRIYQLGLEYFANKHFKESSQIMAYLCTINHLIPEAWIARGAANEAQEKYLRAFFYYVNGISLGEFKFIKYAIHAANCLLRIGETTYCSDFLDNTIQWIEDNKKENDNSDIVKALKKMNKQI